jgi:predicted nucleic acid-binding protein
MAIVCFDTHVLIWGVKNEASSSQQAMIERAIALIQQCTDRKDVVLVPAVVVGEALCNVPAGMQESLFRTLSEQFLIVPYDARAALINARIWQEQAVVHLAQPVLAF